MKKLIVTGLAVVIAAASGLPALGMFATSHAQAKPANSGQAEYGKPTGQDRALTNPGVDNRSERANERLASK